MASTSSMARSGRMTRRGTRKEAKARVKDTDRLLKRAGKSLSDEIKGKIRAKRDSVANALKDKEGKGLRKLVDELGDVADQHLAPYRKPSWQETIESVGVAVLVALLLRSFVVEAFKIPSGSMIPTLSIGDQIFVNKLTYGVRIPFTSIRLLDFRVPERGEVIVFICPCPDHMNFIKRVVALPGDTVEVRDGVVYVNDEALKRGSGEKVDFWARAEHGKWYESRAVRYTETNGDNSYSILLDPRNNRALDDFGPKVIPEGHVFVMGDNRDDSFDSRAWGNVPLENILGQSMFVWWSWGPNGLDTSRLGTWID